MGRSRTRIGTLTVAALTLVFAAPAGARQGAAQFRAGAAVVNFDPPLHGHVPGGDPADCAGSQAFTGARHFAFEEPYTDTQHDGHFDPGDPYLDCNHNGRWDGNLLGGGGNTPRYYTRIADPVTARAVVVSNARRTIAVEVVDQEGLFNVYQQQIRDKVRADGFRLDGIFISATHDESAPDSLGLGGVTAATSGVNDYWLKLMIARSAKAIERAYRALRPARIRYTEVLEPRDLRQCWSSYPFVDDQRIPVLEAVSARGKAIATLASVSQHAETLGFNGGPQSLWISSDWIHFFRTAIERRLGGIAIEMAGSVGSVESPQIFQNAISRTPQQFVDASHPAGCRTVFTATGSEPPLGYNGETAGFGRDMAGPIVHALRAGAYHTSQSSRIWGARASICIPLQNILFQVGAAAGVFAHRPGYNADCTKASPVSANGSSAGQSLKSQVAAFRIGDGEFISVPGEVFPFTYLRGFLGPQDMPNPNRSLPSWLLPHMHTQYRFVDGLAEDMIGYIFPAGNAVGIPTASDFNPSSTDRFGCHHSDDSEATSDQAANIVGAALVKVLDRRGGTPERIARGRYVLPGGKLSRDPLGGPELKCNVDTTFQAAGPAVAVRLSSGRTVHPKAWMSLSGQRQRRPDRDTRGYFDAHARRVWLDVF